MLHCTGFCHSQSGSALTEGLKSHSRPFGTKAAPDAARAPAGADIATTEIETHRYDLILDQLRVVL